MNNLGRFGGLEKRCFIGSRPKVVEKLKIDSDQI